MDTTQTNTLDCGHAPSEHSTFTTGYGTDSDGRTHCYDCCANIELKRMIDTGRATLYFSKGEVTDWVGHLKFSAFNITHSHGYGFGGTKYEIVTGRFRGPDDKLWSFRNAGDNQIARCRRLKDPR